MIVCKIYDRSNIAADCSVVCVVEIGACPCLRHSFGDNYGLLVAADTITTLSLSGCHLFQRYVGGCYRFVAGSCRNLIHQLASYRDFGFGSLA